MVDLDDALKRDIFTMRPWEMTRGFEWILSGGNKVGGGSIVRGLHHQLFAEDAYWGMKG